MIEISGKNIKERLPGKDVCPYCGKSKKDSSNPFDVIVASFLEKLKIHTSNINWDELLKDDFKIKNIEGFKKEMKQEAERFIMGGRELFIGHISTGLISFCVTQTLRGYLDKDYPSLNNFHRIETNKALMQAIKGWSSELYSLIPDYGIKRLRDFFESVGALEILEVCGKCKKIKK